MTGDTNGYSTDRKMIEYRLDETDARLKGIESSIIGLAGDIRELRTVAQGWGRNWGIVAGTISSVFVGVIVWLITR